MKNDENKFLDLEDICANVGSKNLWIIGIAVIILASFFLLAIFKTGGDAASTNTGSGRIIPSPAAGAQQVAFANQNCQPYSGGYNQYYRQGPAAQQVAFQQSSNSVQCPFCAFVYNDINAITRGSSRCPNCQGIVPMQAMGNNGLMPVALPANCMACPTVTQCFPPGQMVALTQPIKAPPIFRDAVMPHRFRGVCENCHIVQPDIAIPSNAIMPHAYRGVCSNCHTILRQKNGV